MSPQSKTTITPPAKDRERVNKAVVVIGKFRKVTSHFAPFAPLSKLASGALPPWIPRQGVSPLHPEHTEMLNIWRKVRWTFRHVFRNFC